MRLNFCLFGAPSVFGNLKIILFLTLYLSPNFAFSAQSITLFSDKPGTQFYVNGIPVGPENVKIFKLELDENSDHFIKAKPNGYCAKEYFIQAPIYRSALYFYFLPEDKEPICIDGTHISITGKKEILAIISDFSSRFCGEFSDSGFTRDVTLSGHAEARLSGFIKQLTDMGIEGTGEFAVTEYVGVRLDQLADELKDVRKCRLIVLQDLLKHFSE